jgi:hypothetical protein
MRRVEIDLDGVVAVARLLEEAAPLTCQALWDLLPIQDRTIHVQWSGAAWRTEGNYQLRPQDAERENLVTELQAGDVIYHANFAIPNLKIGFAYGLSKWLAPYGETLPVDLIGKIEDNLDAFTAVCEKIMYEGPKKVEIRRKA